MRRVRLPIVMSARITAALMVLVWAAPIGAQTMPEFEAPPVFHTSKLFPGIVLTGSNYRIEEWVHNDGYLNVYRLTTPYGTFDVKSTALLNIRLQELHAIQQMEEIERGKAFEEALKKAATSPVRFAGAMLTEPITTTTGVFKGVGSWVSNVGHSIFGSPSEQEAGTFSTLVGYADAKRATAFRFGVDPYSSFKPLQAEISDIAQASFAGGLVVTVAFVPIPGVGGLAVRGTKFGKQMNQRIRDNPPAELKRLNGRILRKMGVHDSMVRTFLDHPKYSPTRTTYLVASMERMNAVPGRSIMIERATLAQDETAAFYFEREAELMAAYHLNVAPARRVVQLGDFPAIQTAAGVLVVIFPFDHLAWTVDLASRADGSADRAAAQIPDVTGKEVWVEGTVSLMARRNIEARGWTVRENVGQRLASQ